MPQPSSSSRHAVTAPVSSRFPLSQGRISTKSGVVVRGRGPVASIADVETELLMLTPDFLGALRDFAPKKRGSKVGYVIALAIIAVIGVLAADTSTREFGMTKGRAIAARLHRAPAAAPAAEPVNAPVVTTAAQVAAVVSVPSVASPATVSAPAEQVAAPVVNVARANAKKGAKSAPAVQSKKLQPRSAVRQSLAGRTATLATKASARDI